MLFLIFVNDLPDWVVNGISMFADDKKICRGIYTVEDQESLQDDLDKLISWSEEWLLKFNPEKCKMMRIGHGLQTEYDMTENGISHQLQVSQEEKDLGIYIADNLRESFQLLYKSYVRPHMEYCVQAWSPYLVQDIECLEKVQRRATKMVRGLSHVL